MWLNFVAVIAALGANAVFRIANVARPPGDYLFATLLPERNLFTYNVEAGGMTVRGTMPGLVGMDSPYPPGGYIDMSTFFERTAKIANHVALSEQALRTLQEMVMRLGINRAPTNDVIQRDVLNFLDKVVLQPHLDRMEWLRGQALLGSISWEFAGKSLSINYGLPPGNVLTPRTGNDAYGGSTSKLWEDIAALRKALRYRQRALIATTATIDKIRFNTINSLVAISEVNGVFTFRRINTNGQFTADAGDVFSIIAYDKEGEVIDPANPAGPTIKVPFFPDGKLLAIGENTQAGYVPGMGSTQPAEDAVELGYTHIAPTTEGGGQPGRWAQLFTPEAAPWSLHGRAVTNGLPVITNADKIAVATTDM
jgi:hypothetical protein